MEISEIAKIETWKLIKVGTFSNVEDLKKAIYKNGDFIGSGAKDLMLSSAFRISQREQEIRLIKKSVKELGFRKVETSLGDILMAAADFGYGECPDETGPQLRLQYVNQPVGEKIHIAMKPITNTAGIPCLFSLLRYGDGEGLLHALVFNPQQQFRLDTCFVFCVG